MCGVCVYVVCMYECGVWYMYVFVPPCPAFYLGSGDQNSSPHVSKVSTSLAECFTSSLCEPLVPRGVTFPALGQVLMYHPASILNLPCGGVWSWGTSEGYCIPTADGCLETRVLLTLGEEGELQSRSSMLALGMRVSSGEWRSSSAKLGDVGLWG